jgi:hypothetical protein
MFSTTNSRQDTMARDNSSQNAHTEDTIPDTESESITNQEPASDGEETNSTQTRSQPTVPEEERSEQSQYLVGLDYEERSERRRVEYRLEDYDGNVSKVPRMTRIVSGEDFYELYEELQDTVDDQEHLFVYELDDLTPSIEEKTLRIDRVFDIDLDRLEWAKQSLLDKRSATHVSGTTYEVQPEAGDQPVEIECHLIESKEGSRLEMTLTGSTPAPNAVKEAMLRDLGYLLPEPTEVFDS